MAKGEKRSAIDEVVTRECTIHLHNHVRKWKTRKRTPQAVKAIKKFATRHMGTKDVRIDPKLNKALWEHGIRGAPHRIRVRLARLRNEEEGAVEKLYTHVSHVPVESFKGLQTVVVEE